MYLFYSRFKILYVKRHRFYDVDEGSITIDDRDIRSLNSSYLRGNVLGYINQEPTLFATSVMENIRYGRQDATDEEVKHKSIEYIKYLSAAVQNILHRLINLGHRGSQRSECARIHNEVPGQLRDRGWRKRHATLWWTKATGCYRQSLVETTVCFNSGRSNKVGITRGSYDLSWYLSTCPCV